MPNEDPRFVRSRQALIEAMTAVLDSDEPESVMNVSEVVRVAGVTRPTFYGHFGDLATLTRAAALARLDATFAQVPDAAVGESWLLFARGTLHTLLAELREHARFYLRSLQGPGGHLLVGDITDYLARRLLDDSPLGPIIRRRPGPDTAAERAEFLAAGTVRVVTRWLEREPHGEDALEAMVDRIAALLLSASGASEAEIAAVRSTPTLPPKDR